MPNFLRKPNPVRVTNDDDLGGTIDAMRALKSSIAWRRRFSPKGWTKVIPCLLLPLLTVAAGAQVPTRATLLRAERQAKVERATPPQRESIEKGLRTFEKAFGRFNRVKRGSPGKAVSRRTWQKAPAKGRHRALACAWPRVEAS